MVKSHIELVLANALSRVAGVGSDNNKRSSQQGTIYSSLNQLCNIADNFDHEGYEKFAKYIDEIIEKISKEAF